jgi:hypothetical protein
LKVRPESADVTGIRTGGPLGASDVVGAVAVVGVVADDCVTGAEVVGGRVVAGGFVVAGSGVVVLPPVEGVVAAAPGTVVIVVEGRPVPVATDRELPEQPVRAMATAAPRVKVNRAAVMVRWTSPKLRRVPMVGQEI